MFARQIEEHLEAVEHVLPCFLACLLGAAVNAFMLARRKEALGHSVVVAVALRLIECSRVPHSTVTWASSRFNWRIGMLGCIAGYRLRKLTLPSKQRVLTDTEPLGQFPYAQ